MTDLDILATAFWQHRKLNSVLFRSMVMETTSMVAYDADIRQSLAGMGGGETYESWCARSHVDHLYQGIKEIHLRWEQPQNTFRTYIWDLVCQCQSTYMIG
jgi:hypothetical protein